MENFLRKSLIKREKCFEENICPEWLLTILPTRLKSVESIVDHDNEQDLKFNIDFSPYQFNSTIPILNSDNFLSTNSTSSSFEYPNVISFEDQQLRSYSQFLCSPSNNQLLNLLNKFQELKENKRRNSHQIFSIECEQMNCSNLRVPLTLFCKDHLLKNDFKQILFVKCDHCNQISIKYDQKHLLHICSH